ncbi:MAG: FAD-binding oxidoreductase [Bdellovibrionales bacterium]
MQATLDKIKNVLGPSGYIDDPARMEPFVVAWRGGWRGKTPLIALPASTEEISAVVKFCAQNKIGIVPQGGNTGTVGGCIPSMENNQIVIGLSRLNKIRNIDRTGSAVTAEAGVILQTLQDAAAEAGFLFPISMASQGSAQIGGAISTNAGGTAVLRYGNTRSLVLGIEAVLANGEVFSGLKSLRKDNMGYNLAQYFIGSEGTLGIVTAATLRLFPKPRQSLTAIAAIPNAEAALELLGDFQRECGEYLSAFEIISETAMALVIKNIPGTRMPGSPAPYFILIEIDSASPGVPLPALFETVTVKALQNGSMSDAVVAENIAQARQLWHLRENISEAIRKESSAIHFDIALPLNEIAPFLMQLEPRIKAVAPDIRIAPFGHIGDGNLHYNMCFARPQENFAELKAKIQDIVYGEVARRDGSLSAEHGIGTARKAVLAQYKPASEIEMMKKIKHALDPDGLMNPGKIFD